MKILVMILKKSFPGIIGWLIKKFLKQNHLDLFNIMKHFKKISLCKICNGKRLNPIALNTKISNLNIMELSSLSIKDSPYFF